jgi:hypothetical protein
MQNLIMNNALPGFWPLAQNDCQLASSDPAGAN